MRKLLVSSIFVLIFCISLLAQTNKSSPCPTISITGPPGIVEPNNTAIYIVNVDTKEKDLKLKYTWSITAGEILEGQGTQIIAIKQPEMGNLTVTVKVMGFPEGCSDITSETLIGDPVFTAIKIDKFSIPAPRIDKARLDYLINELQNNPNAVAYVIEKFGRKISRNARELKIRKLTDYLFKVKKIKKDRIVIWYAKSYKTITEFFIVPAGAKPPKCDGCFI